MSQNFRGGHASHRGIGRGYDIGYSQRGGYGGGTAPPPLFSPQVPVSYQAPPPFPNFRAAPPQQYYNQPAATYNQNYHSPPQYMPQQTNGYGAGPSSYSSSAQRSPSAAVNRGGTNNTSRPRPASAADSSSSLRYREPTADTFDPKAYVKNIIEAYHQVEDCSQIFLSQSSLPFAKVDLELDNGFEGINVHSEEAPFSCTWKFNVFASNNATLKHVSFLCRDSSKSFSFIHLNGHVLPNMKVVLGDNFKNFKKPGIYEVKIGFSCQRPGIFKQWVCFDFTGQPPYIARQLHVFVGNDRDPAFHVEKFRFETTVADLEWNSSTVDIVLSDWPAYDREVIARQLLARWKPLGASLENDSLALRTTGYGPDNYKRVMHGLIRLEEAAVTSTVGRVIIDTPEMKVSRSPDGIGWEGFISLGEALDPRTRMGSLTLRSATRMLLACQDYAEQGDDDGRLRHVYEADIIQKVRGAQQPGGPNEFYSTGVRLHLSQRFVMEQKLRENCVVTLHQARFQTTRLPFVEWQDAVERVSCWNVLFPQLDLHMVPQLDLDREYLDKQIVDPGLLKNPNQCRVVQAILGNPSSVNIVDPSLPPIIIQGAFGTGKTFTLANALMLLLNKARNDPSIRIVLCTMSNSAADLYVKNYLHPFITKLLDAQPRSGCVPRILRIYRTNRDPSTVDADILTYCKLQQSRIRPGLSEFAPVTMPDIMSAQLVITNLVGAIDLTRLCLQRTTFSHLFLDEAAQSFEADTTKALSLAGPKTRVVMAGDPRQMAGGQILCPLLKKYGFDRALIERLLLYYGKDYETFGKLGYGHLLQTNYRCHPKIMEFIRLNFYADLRNMKNEYICEFTDYFPFRFYNTDNAGGVEQFHQESTTFYNMAEAEEVKNQVTEMLKHWPEPFLEYDAAGQPKSPQSGIAVVCPYDAQVMVIQKLLRQNEETAKVNVSHIQWIQGMEFRAIFISTVRTLKPSGDDQNFELGFLSDRRLLNTAITRARSVVVIVGSEKTLTTVGPCASVWQSLIRSCRENHTFFSADSARQGMPAAQNYAAATEVGRQLLQSRYEHVTVVPNYAEQQLMMANYGVSAEPPQRRNGPPAFEHQPMSSRAVAITDHESAEMRHRYPKFVQAVNDLLMDSSNLPMAWGAATGSRMIWLKVIGSTEYLNNIRHPSNTINRDEISVIVDLVRGLSYNDGEILIVCATAAQATQAKKMLNDIPREKFTILDAKHPLPPHKTFSYLVMSFVRTAVKSERALNADKALSDRLGKAKGYLGPDLIDMELIPKIMSTSGGVAFIGNHLTMNVFPAYDWLFRRLSQQGAVFNGVRDLGLQQPAQSG